VAKTARLVRFEAPHHFPFPLDQLAWDFQLLDDAPANSDGEQKTSQEKNRRALLIAARRATVTHFLAVFERLNMPVDLLQPDFVALHNFLVHDYLAVPGGSAAYKTAPVVAALDVGSDVTNLVVSSPWSLWFRSCGVAGNSFALALIKEFNLTFAQAEQQKRTPESAERISELYKAMSPVFEDLLNELRQSLAAYVESHSDCPVQQILCLGGGAALHGLFRYLRYGQ
jgi:Tfp pilus assembly PilM family ATPase